MSEFKFHTLSPPGYLLWNSPYSISNHDPIFTPPFSWNINALPPARNQVILQQEASNIAGQINSMLIFRKYLRRRVLNVFDNPKDKLNA